MNALLHEANEAMARWLLRQYLPTDGGRNVWTHGGACISACRAARFGLPPDAACWRVLVEHPELGWSFSVRAVWRAGELMSAKATHCVIQNYYPDNEALVIDEAAACQAVNIWFRSL